MSEEKRKNRLRAFWDFFVLFSGISTASNLSRTQRRPVKANGLFLFRSRKEKLPGRSAKVL
ncbi:MAG TPA: hypothetical protein VI320_18880 [Terracidiphilus sp.]|jgi:hypothetical protein